MSSSNYIIHSGGPWKNHKYIAKEGDKYIYRTSSSGGSGNSRPSRDEGPKDSHRITMGTEKEWRERDREHRMHGTRPVDNEFNRKHGFPHGMPNYWTHRMMWERWHKKHREEWEKWMKENKKRWEEYMKNKPPMPPHPRFHDPHPGYKFRRTQ